MTGMEVNWNVVKHDKAFYRKGRKCARIKCLEGTLFKIEDLI